MIVQMRFCHCMSARAFSRMLGSLSLSVCVSGCGIYNSAILVFPKRLRAIHLPRCRFNVGKRVLHEHTFKSISYDDVVVLLLRCVADGNEDEQESHVKYTKERGGEPATTTWQQQHTSTCKHTHARSLARAHTLGFRLFYWISFDAIRLPVISYT